MKISVCLISKRNRENISNQAFCLMKLDRLKEDTTDMGGSRTFLRGGGMHLQEMTSLTGEVNKF